MPTLQKQLGNDREVAVWHNIGRFGTLTGLTLTPDSKRIFIKAHELFSGCWAEDVSAGFDIQIYLFNLCENKNQKKTALQKR